MKSVKAGKYELWCTNEQEGRWLAKEIFRDHSYYLDLDEQPKRIIDAGAHFGFATIYFRQLFPQSQIIAIEPNPKAVEFLNLNLESNHIENVEVHQLALAEGAGKRNLYFDASGDFWYSVAGFHEGSWDETQHSLSRTVETVGLKHFLTEPVDILKMDIEGAELEVLRGSKPYLRKIKHLILEYHPLENNPLKEILEILEEAGFEYEMENKGRGLKLITGTNHNMS